MSVTLASLIVEVHGDTDKLKAEVVDGADKAGKRAGTAIGAQLNKSLRTLKLPKIDIKADPKQAQQAIRDTEVKLRALSADAATFEVKVRSEQALAQITRLRKQIGDLDPPEIEVKADTSPAQRQIEALNVRLRALDQAPISLDADPAQAIREIENVQLRLARLSADSATVHVKIEADKVGGELAKLKAAIGDVGGDSAQGFAAKFGAKVGPLLESLPLSPALLAAAGAAVVALGPLLGAAVAGGIIGGVGIGGVVGGLTLAAKDQRVQAAAKTVGDNLKGRLEQAAVAFVGPAIDGMQTIENAIARINLERIFQATAKFVKPLANGVSGAIGELGGAIDSLVQQAGPVISTIGEGINQIGKSLGDGLKSLADNGPEASNALRELFGIINIGISSTFGLVNILTELYGIVHKLGLDAGLQIVLEATGTQMDKTSLAARRVGDSTSDMSGEFQEAKDKADELKKANEFLKPAQDAVANSQRALTETLDGMGGANTRAARTSAALKTAMDNLYGASIRQADANEDFQASWDSLSESVKTNSGEFRKNENNLSANTKAGRSNRDTLKALIQSNNDLYIADIAAGVSVEKATQKHKARTEQVRKESVRLGLNRTETGKLITTYGKIPPKKATDLVLDGVREVVRALKDIYIFQRALADGIPVESERAKLNEKGGKAKTAVNSGYASGGKYDGGKLYGSPSDHDNMHGRGPQGEEIDLAGGEYIVNAKQTKKHFGIIDAINKDQLAYAGGGQLAPVDTSSRWEFPADVSNSKVLSRAQARAKVTIPPGAFGKWPASPGAQRGDSGVWRKVVALIRSTGPLSGSFGNGYRPGDPLWHGSGRAVDWMGFNQDRLAEFLAARHPLELIHRSSKRDYAYTRGRNKGSFNNSLMQAHRNHIHIAFNQGGPLDESIAQMTAADFGSVTLKQGWNMVKNGTGKPEPLVSPGSVGGDVHIHLHNSVIASKAQFEDLLVDALASARTRKRVGV